MDNKFQDKNLLLSIIEGTEDHIFVKDLEGHYIFINSSTAHFLKRSVEEVIGKNDTDLYSQDLAAKLRKYDQEVINAGKPMKYEEVIHSPEGKQFVMITTKAPYRDQYGKIIGVLGISKDITARKMAEEKLRAEHAYRKPIEEAMLAGVAAVDLEGKIIYVNPAFCKLVGWEENELLGLKPPHPFWPPKDAGHIKEMFQKRIKSENSLTSAEYQFQRRNGDRIHVLVSTASLTDGYGNKIGAVSSFTDITSQKLYEIKLKESYNLFHSILEGTTDSIFVRNLNGGYLMINSSAARVFGKSVEELTGERTSNFIPNDIVQKFKEDDQKVLKSGKTETFEVKLTVNGVDQIYLTTKGPVRDYKGDIFGVFGISRNITDLKTAEEKLKAELAFRGSIEKALLIGITAADLSGKLIYVNPHFCEMVGWPAEELIGTFPPRPFWPSEEIERNKKLFQSRLNDKEQPKVQELIFCRKNGERFPVLLFNSDLIDGNGNKIGMVASFIDISEKKKMEEELNKVEKLKSLEILAGGIAHDFNNILTAILGNLSLAMMELDPHLPATQYLSETEAATLKAKNLASQLLSYTKGNVLHKKMTSIAKLIEDSTTFALRGSKLIPEFHFPDRLWGVEVDPDQFTQVIHNLAINAQQAMAEGGGYVIRADNVIVNDLSAKNLHLNPGPFVLITFKDNGQGIPQDLMNKIFDPFFTTKEKGSGLGLFSAYSIIKNHKGTIQVKSRVDAGTTFSIYLPALNDTQIREDQKTEPIIFGSGRILLVDDDDAVRKMAGTMIQTLGYKVELATKGEEALEMYRKAKEINQTFQVVILDLTIPGGKGGKQTLQELLTFDPSVRAIVSSGYSTDPIMQNYQEYGFKERVVKPYRIQDLSKALSNILKKE